MNPNTLVRQANDELNSLQACGFETWCKKVWELLRMYGISLNYDLNSFKKLTKCNVNIIYIKNWSAEINNLEQIPIMRRYSILKQ